MTCGCRRQIVKMGINLGDVFPNFEADTTIGRIKFHDWVGKDGYVNHFAYLISAVILSF